MKRYMKGLFALLLAFGIVFGVTACNWEGGEEQGGFEDESYLAHEIQIKQGYDLEAYRGKTVKHYSYAVTNYPDTSHSVRANLLIYEGEIIGGDICSLNIDGFMHGFAKDK